MYARCWWLYHSSDSLQWSIPECLQRLVFIKQSNYYYLIWTKIFRDNTGVSLLCMESSTTTIENPCWICCLSNEKMMLMNYHYCYYCSSSFELFERAGRQTNSDSERGCVQCNAHLCSSNATYAPSQQLSHYTNTSRAVRMYETKNTPTNSAIVHRALNRRCFCFEFDWLMTCWPLSQPLIAQQRVKKQFHD